MANPSYSFEDSTIWQEVQGIINSPQKRLLYDYKGTVHTEKEDIPVWDLISIEGEEDFVKNIGDSVKAVFWLSLGDYAHRFYPYRQNLEFTLKRFPMDASGSAHTPSSATIVTRYKAIFNVQQNPPVGGSELESANHDDLNKEMVEVHLELVDRSLEPLRVKTTGGAYRQVTPEMLVRSVLGNESSNVRVDGKPAIDSIDMVIPDNKEVINNVILPSGLAISALPTYVQHSVGGVYNAGIGTYFRAFEGKKTWFIYPLYSTERFDSKDKKIIFYAVPQEKLPQLDKSWRKEGNVVKVAVTAQRRYNDSAELKFMNEGSGYRMADARAFMKKPVEITEDGIQASRARLNHEVVVKQRSDGLNYAPVGKTGPSSNPYLERSRVQSRNVAQLDLVWENADPELIYPGMPCKYIYMSQGRPVSLKGTILFLHHLTAKVERQNASAFRMTCRITIACETQTKTPDLPPKEAVGNA